MLCSVLVTGRIAQHHRKSTDTQRTKSEYKGKESPLWRVWDTWSVRCSRSSSLKWPMATPPSELCVVSSQMTNSLFHACHARIHYALISFEETDCTSNLKFCQVNKQNHWPYPRPCSKQQKSKNIYRCKSFRLQAFINSEYKQSCFTKNYKFLL